MANETSRPHLIELRLGRIAQLFQSLDPSPFRERDLDGDAEEFIVGWARELPESGPLEILLHVPADEVRTAIPAEVEAAIRGYFADRAEKADRELRELHRQGRRALAIGLPILALCPTASQIAQSLFDGSKIAKLVEESLIILGWVANWRPIEIFLYDRDPIIRRARLYRRLAAASIRIRQVDG